MSIQWTKEWSGADDGTIITGADLGNLQRNIDEEIIVAVSDAVNDTVDERGLLEPVGEVEAEIDEAKLSHKVPVLIGGVQYYIMLIREEEE